MRRGNRLQTLCKESQTKTALDPGSEEVFHLIFFPRKKRSWGQKNGQKIGTEEDWELCPPLTLGTKAKSYTVQKNSFFRVTVPPTNRPTNQPTVLLPPSTHLAFLFLLFWSRTKGGKRKKTESRSWQRQLSTTMLPPTTKEDGWEAATTYYTMSHQPLSPSFADPKKGAFFV